MLNEKRLVQTAGLEGVRALFAQLPAEPAGLVRWVGLVAGRLGAPKDEAAAWK